MTNFYVTYTLSSKEARDGYMEAILAEGIDQTTRGEDGCIRYDYFYPVGSDTTLFLWEQWETREHQKAHCQTAHFARLGELKEKFGATTEIQVEDKA